MKAKNLSHISNEPAPKEWSEIKEIKECRPNGFNKMVSLQKLDNHNICVWMVNIGDGYWNPGSDYFYVKK